MEQQPGLGPKIQEQGKGPSIGFYAVHDDFKYAIGWQVFCNNCNKPCYSAMSYYPCREDFSTVSDVILVAVGLGD